MLLPEMYFFMDILWASILLFPFTNNFSKK